MSICTKCWGDAYMRAMASGRSQTDEYHLLLIERADNPCPPDSCDMDTLLEERAARALSDLLPASRDD